MPIDYAHCLRQRFTENILMSLLDATSVNVVVPKIGEEADRLVADVKACQLQNARVLAVNMRFCRGSYQQFLLDLWRQYHQQPAQECPDLSAILADLEKQPKQNFIIVLNQLDAMCANDVDEQFDHYFYVNLNSLKNYRNVALLVITESSSYHGLLFNIGGVFKTSKLDIQQIEYLPALTRDEARYELSRRHPELSTVHISHLLQQGQHRTLGYDYALLDYLSRQLSHSTQFWDDDMASFIRQLKNWHKRYKQQSKQAEYHAKKIVEAVDKVSTIFNVKALFKKLFLVLKVILADPILALIELFKDWLKKKSKD